MFYTAGHLGRPCIIISLLPHKQNIRGLIPLGNTKISSLDGYCFAPKIFQKVLWAYKGQRKRWKVDLALHNCKMFQCLCVACFFQNVNYLFAPLFLFFACSNDSSSYIKSGMWTNVVLIARLMSSVCEFNIMTLIFVPLGAACNMIHLRAKVLFLRDFK